MLLPISREIKGILLGALSLFFVVTVATPASGKGLLTLCLDPLNMPYSAMGEDPPGFDVEIGKAIGKIMKRMTTIRWTNTATQGGISRALNHSIVKGECNAFMGIPYDEELIGELTEKGLVLTKAYMVASEVVVVGKHSPKVTSIDDLAKLRTGVQFGTLGQGILIRRKFERTMFRFPNEVLEAVEKGEVDVALMFGSITGWLIQQEFKGRVEISKDFVPSEEHRWEMGIAVLKEDTELKEEIDAAIHQLWSEDRINPIMNKYGVNSLRPKGM